LNPVEEIDGTAELYNRKNRNKCRRKEEGRNILAEIFSMLSWYKSLFLQLKWPKMAGGIKIYTDLAMGCNEATEESGPNLGTEALSSFVPKAPKCQPKLPTTDPELPAIAVPPAFRAIDPYYTIFTTHYGNYSYKSLCHVHEKHLPFLYSKDSH